MTMEKGAQRFAILSDIHANAPAFQSALKTVRTLHIDTLVILGDLLTYGCTPVDTLALLESALDDWHTVLITGNHDRMYFDLAKNDFSYLTRLPDWIQESARWTTEQVTISELRARYPWRSDAQFGAVYVSHANPFGTDDWRYLNSERDLQAAAHALPARGASIGVFGHTHRPKACLLRIGEHVNMAEIKQRRFSANPSSDDCVVVINPGSIGQSRSRNKRATFLTITADQGTYDFAIHDVGYDRQAHIRSIEDSRLSPATKRKLISFYNEVAQ